MRGRPCSGESIILTATNRNRRWQRKRRDHSVDVAGVDEARWGGTCLAAVWMREVRGCGLSPAVPGLNHLDLGGREKRGHPALPLHPAVFCSQHPRSDVSEEQEGQEQLSFAISLLCWSFRAAFSDLLIVNERLVLLFPRDSFFSIFIFVPELNKRKPSLAWWFPNSFSYTGQKW